MGNSKTKKYLSDNVFNTEVQYCGHIFTTPSGEGTAIYTSQAVSRAKKAESLSFTYTANGKRQIQVENFSK